MASKTSTSKKSTTTAGNGALVNDDRPAGKGKGGTVTQHGVTTTGYQRGCRCDECKAAMAAYTAARRESGKSEADKAAEAKAAKAAKAKERREAKKAAKAAEAQGGTVEDTTEA